MKHIKGLDTFRAFAVIFTIYAHWNPREFEPRPIISFIKEYLVPDGHSGVDFFFVLSGFLITAILLDAREKSGEQNKLTIVKNFMARRALRIFPIYYLLVLLLLLIGYEGLKDHVGYYLAYASNILFFSKGSWGPIGHTWSLAVEEQFYLFWPWVILFINRKYLKHVFIGSIIISTVFNYITYYVIERGAYPLLVINCLECFGMGGFYAYARTDSELCRKFERTLKVLFFVSLPIYFYWRYAHGVFWERTTFLFKIIDGIIGLQFIVMIINNRSERIRKYLLENKVLNHIGKISYGIYLFHEPFQPLYDGFIGRLMVKHPQLPAIINNYYFSYWVKMALLFLICSLSFRFIEQPLLNLKSRFNYNQ